VILDSKKKTFKYDDNRNIIEEKIFNNFGEFYSKEMFKYDSKGNLIEANKYNSHENLEEKWTLKYEFDEKGNWIKKVTYVDGEVTRITERTIDYY
jgi:antitoxin component YwqK of YwqJK toxin-antitoxin module